MLLDTSQGAISVKLSADWNVTHMHRSENILPFVHLIESSASENIWKLQQTLKSLKDVSFTALLLHMKTLPCG